MLRVAFLGVRNRGFTIVLKELRCLHRSINLIRGLIVSGKTLEIKVFTAADINHLQLGRQMFDSPQQKQRDYSD